MKIRLLVLLGLALASGPGIADDGYSRDRRSDGDEIYCFDDGAAESCLSISMDEDGYIVCLAQPKQARCFSLYFEDPSSEPELSNPFGPFLVPDEEEFDRVLDC